MNELRSTCDVTCLNNRLFISFLTAACIVLVCFITPGGGDIYTRFELIRPYGYYAILSCFKFLFGNVFFQYPLMFLQYFFWFYTTKLLLDQIKISLRICGYAIYAGLFFVVLPIATNKLPSTLMTDAFSFACWQIFFCHIIALYRTQNKRYILWCALWVFIGLSLRAQMLLLAAMMTLVGVLILPRSRAITMYIFCALFCAVLMNGIIERSAHYIAHDYWGVPPIFGMQAGIAPIYLFDDYHASFVAEPKIRADLVAISDALKKKGLHRTQVEANQAIPQIMYSYLSVYNPIRDVIYDQAVAQGYCKNPETLNASFVQASQLPRHGLVDLLAFDHYCIRLAKAATVALFRQNPLKPMAFYMRNIIYLGFGSLQTAILIAALLALAFTQVLYSQRMESFLLLFSTAACFVNYGGIALVEPILFRYKIYSMASFDIIVFSLLLALFERSLSDRGTVLS